jgi:hypothetical protein
VSGDLCDLTVAMTHSDGSLSDTLMLDSVQLDDAPLDGDDHVNVALEAAEKRLAAAGYALGGAWQRFRDYSTAPVTYTKLYHSNEWGWLCDYSTGEPLRAATENEWRRSVDSGTEEGVFMLARTVYVDGGPC